MYYPMKNHSSSHARTHTHPPTNNENIRNSCWDFTTTTSQMTEFIYLWNCSRRCRPKNGFASKIYLTTPRMRKTENKNIENLFDFFSRFDGSLSLFHFSFQKLALIFIFVGFDSIIHKNWFQCRFHILCVWSGVLYVIVVVVIPPARIKCPPHTRTKNPKKKMKEKFIIENTWK